MEILDEPKEIRIRFISEERTRFGKLMVIIGTGICLMPLFIIVGGPIYLTGIVFIWLSKEIERAKKLKWTFYPIGIVALAWSFMALLFWGFN